MPIKNYQLLADRSERRLFANPKISEGNKNIIRRFLTAYDVSDARRQIFTEKIQKLLEAFPSLEEALTDRDRINTLFAELRQQYSPASYITYARVSQRLLTWMNEGERPKSLCDLKRLPKSKLKRNLRPEDMLTWSDGERIADASFGIQLSAIILTQLDCGFRPSELVDLNYGDVELREGLAIISVRNGKTGERVVIAHRCLEELGAWMSHHPTKKANDPLWISEKSISTVRGGKTHIERYAYPAMTKRIRLIARKIGIQKPMDFYSLRHSSCVLDKLDNLPMDLAAERHGHGVNFFVETYGRLSVEDVAKRFDTHYGIERASKSPKTAEIALPQTTAAGDSSTQAELGRLKQELDQARLREQGFLKQQQLLLEQVQEVRLAVRTYRSNAIGPSRP